MSEGDRVKGASIQRPTIHRIGAVLPYHNNMLSVHRHGHNAWWHGKHGTKSQRWKGKTEVMKSEYGRPCML